jgi:hypothetical protein
MGVVPNHREETEGVFGPLYVLAALSMLFYASVVRADPGASGPPARTPLVITHSRES